MKKLIAFIIGLAFIASASAADYSVTTLTNGLKVAGSATVTLSATAPVITLTKFEDVTINIAYGLDNTGTGAQTYTFQKSVDGTNFDTVNSFVVAVAGKGSTGYGYISTNINVGAAGYLRLVSVQNGQAGQYCTNNISYTLKKRRNG